MPCAHSTAKRKMRCTHTRTHTCAHIYWRKRASDQQPRKAYRGGPKPVINSFARRTGEDQAAELCHVLFMLVPRGVVPHDCCACACRLLSGSIYAFWFDISVRATYDARGYFAWALLGIIFFLRSLYSKFGRGLPGLELIRKPRPLAVNNVAPLDPLLPVQFSPGLTLVGIIFFLRSLNSKFSSGVRNQTLL